MSDLFEFEYRIWKVRDWEWRWEVRHAGLASKPFAAGHSDRKKDARHAVEWVITEERQRLDAPWREFK